MTTIDENLAPVPVPGVDPRSLEIHPSPEDFFILSRVNGSMTVSQLCSTSGLGRTKTLASIERLLASGLIQLPGLAGASSPSPSTTPSAAAASSAADDDEDEDLAASIRARFPIDFDSFHYDPQLMSQQVEIDDLFKQEILFVHAQLDDVDYYQLLGASMDASRRQLRRAYFRMSKRYHPDRFFRKLLGDFEPRIEAIFHRITKAYQTLSHRNKRSEYDALLKAAASPSSSAKRPYDGAQRQREPREAKSSERKRELAYQLLLSRAESAFQAGDIAGAIGQFRNALRLNREASLALDVAQRLLAISGHLDDAVAFARAAQKIDPSTASTWKVLGEIYEKKGQIDDALYHFEKAQERAPQDLEIEQSVQRLRL